MPAATGNRRRLIIGAITSIAIIAGIIGLSIGLTSQNKGSGNKAAVPAKKEESGTFNIKSLVEGILQTAPTPISSADETVTTTVKTPSIEPDQKTALTFAQEVDQREQTALVPNAEAVKALMSGK